MKLIYSAVVVLFMSSCSSTSWNDLFEKKNAEKENKELLESFGTEEEVLEKFTENKEKKEELKQEAKVKSQAPKQVKNNEKLAAKSGPVVKPAEKPAEQISKTAPAKLPEAKTRFPKDYPAELKQISAGASKLWGEYRPRFYPGESIVMDINYMGISTGKIVLTTEPDTVIGDQTVHHARARVKTSDYYRYLYELDDNIDSYISVESKLPVKFSLIQRESGQDVDDLQLFDHDELVTHSFYQRVSDDKTKKRKWVKNVPTHFTDPLYVIWFLRGLPMEKGREFNIPIMNRGKVIILHAVNDGEVTLDTAIGEKKAYKMTASTTYTGDTLKSGDMTFWFSADEKRTFLKFNAKIKIGSISGDIEKYEP